MIILLDTSTGTCHCTLVRGDEQFAYAWQTERTLARDLLALMRDALAEHGAVFHDITGIGVYEGPGSFTGLRIGITVMNTLADDLDIPIVGATGDEWQAAALSRLRAGVSDTIVMPEYGGAENITFPKK